VKADMQTPQPMDRLICGDVGFGKTEVAVRAAFKAVMDGYQVAMLAAPSWPNSTEHLQERLASLPARVAMLSASSVTGRPEVVGGPAAASTSSLAPPHPAEGH
jgi:transcription-repair coupling factor (superfamily II helicase)